MKRGCVLAAAALLVLLTGRVARADLPAVFQQVRPSVVYILSAVPAGTASGSGFVYASGESTSMIATAAHVVAGATKIDVVLDNDRSHRYPATVKQIDLQRDVAFLEIPVGNRVPLKLAERPEIAEGMAIAAIGYPRAAASFERLDGDLQPSIHTGVVSAVRLNGEVVQIDAAVDHGDSGGPIVDANTGHVIGLVRGALLDGQYLARGLEQALPGSAYAASATTIYGVRNGLTVAVPVKSPVPDAVGTSPAYRLGFVGTQVATTAAVQALLVTFSERIRSHFTQDNSLYPINVPRTVFGLTSSAMINYCKSARLNGFLWPLFSWHIPGSGSANTTAEMLVTDCEGIPLFMDVERKAESTNGRGARELVDMMNDLIDRVIVAFDTYRTKNADAWTMFLKTGSPLPADSTVKRAGIAVLFHENELRVWRLAASGRGQAAGLRVNDLIVTIDGKSYEPKTPVMEIDTLLESSHLIVVKRPEGTVTISLDANP